MIKKSKTLNELNLIDSFLFSSSTENIQDAEFIARLIIKRATGHTLDKITIHPEKQFKGLNINKRGIRMDLYVTETRDSGITKYYDIEPNTYGKKNLPHRSRFYQSKVDSKNLNAGAPFTELPDFMSIWILSYDPFNENRMIYHIKNVIEENPDICYNDGTAKIYLYTGGELGGSKELKELLRFFQDSQECNATDDELKKLLKIVNRIKNDEKVGEEYMIFKDDLDYEREEAREEGLAEGLAEGMIKGIIRSYRNFNASDEQIISALMQECKLTEDEAREKLACSN